MGDVDEDFNAAMGHLSTIHSYYKTLDEGAAPAPIGTDGDSTVKSSSATQVQDVGVTEKQTKKDGDDVVAEYGRQKSGLSLSDRLALAETCLGQLHSLNKSLVRELAFFKAGPQNSLERLLLDPQGSFAFTASNKVGGDSEFSRSNSSSSGSSLGAGRRARSADPDRKPARGPRRSTGSTRISMGSDRGGVGSVRRDQGGSHAKCEAERAKLLRTFNLKLHHAEQQECDSSARAVVLQQELDTMRRNYDALAVRATHQRCLSVRVGYVLW